MFSAHSQNLPYGSSSFWLWLAPICAERRQVPRPLAIAANTCVDVPSSVVVFGLPDLLVSVAKPVLLYFVISFATVSWFIAF
ncbi:hypothetical protein AVEN_20098-1, partial [Araneus ventricosus]